MTAASQTIEPFPGLRPFRPEEAPLFFGRDEEIEKLLVRLSERRFLAVVGTSGSGKSSLVRAGFIPTIQRGHLGPTGSRWVIATVERPGLDPLHGLARALQQAFHLEDEAHSLEAALTRSNSGLADFGQAHLAPEQRLLIFVDQFEELFRYRRQAGEDGRIRSTKFVKLLLAATGHSDLVAPLRQPPIYVVLTMRSDYLGKCAEFRGLPEALNDSQYLVPRMGRDQLRETIEGPLALAGAEISDQLVDRLLNDTGDNPDLLPVLQHALLRIWEVSSDVRAAGSPIDLPHYENERVQGMGRALDLDAEAAYAKLNGDPRKEAAARRIFQRLVEPGAADEETRRPTRLSELIRVCGLEASEVRAVLDVFAERGFVTLSADDDPLVDIPHEALIRQWGRLSRWVADEKQSARIYVRLSDAARHGVRLRGAYLDTALGWEKKESPNAAWAERYGGDERRYSQAIQFLRSSHRWLQIRRLLLVVLVAGIAALALVFYFLLDRANRQKRMADSLRFVSTAQLYRETRPDLSMLLSVEAYKSADAFEAKNALLTGLESSPGLLAFLHHEAPVPSVAFSPDGKTLASASGATVRLWDVATWQPLGKPLEGHTDWVTSVAFSPDGKTLASASPDKTVRLWDVVTHRPLGKPLEGHTDWVTSVAFSPDGKTLASASAEKTVRLWDVVTHRPLGKPLEGHTDLVDSVAFSADGKTLASASDDKTLRLWDVATRAPLGKPLEGHKDPVYSVAFSPDGKMLASASDKTVRLWDVATRAPLGKPLEGHTDPVYSVAFSPDGNKLASAGFDKTVRLWDVATRAPLGKPLEGHTDPVYSVAFSPDGKTLASASDDKTVRLWNLAARQHLGNLLEGHTDDIWCVTFSPDGKTLASASKDTTVRLWDVATRQQLGKPLEGHTHYVSSVAFSPDGKMLASASRDKTMRLWDVATHQPVGKPLEGHTAAINSVFFSPDGKTLASGSDDTTVRLWDVATHQPFGKPFNGHTGSVQSVAFSPDSTTLASASLDGTVRLWDVATRHQSGNPLKGHTEFVEGVTFSSDSKTLASASADKTVRLWDVATRQPLGKPLEGHVQVVNSVAFSPDGKTLASASYDKTVRLWDVASGQPLGKPLEGHTEEVHSVAFSPDGKTLASGSADTTVLLWDVDSESWVRRTCSIVNRNLTTDEWSQFIGRDVPYRKTCPNLPTPDVTAH